MWIFNATKIFSLIFYSVELPLLYWSTHLWLQVLLNHVSSEESKFVKCDGCIFELTSFVDTPQVVCVE